MVARNYAIADKFKPKIYIPIIGIEIHGRLTLILFIIANLVFVGSIGSLLSLVIGGSTGYYLSLFIALCVTFVSLEYVKTKDKNSGSNKLQNFYYHRIRHYDEIIDANGNKRYIPESRKGVYFIYVS